MSTRKSQKSKKLFYNTSSDDEENEDDIGSVNSGSSERNNLEIKESKKSESIQNDKIEEREHKIKKKKVVVVYDDSDDEIGYKAEKKKKKTKEENEFESMKPEDQYITIESDGGKRSKSIKVTEYPEDVFDYENGVSKKKTRAKGKSIMKDMVSINIPDDIKQRADNIYRSMNTGVHRKGNRSCLVYYCILNAYKEADCVVDPYDLTRLMGVSPKVHARAKKLFPTYLTGYIPPQVDALPRDYITIVGSKLSFSSEAMEMVENLFNELEEIDNTVAVKKPRDFIIGLFWYFIDIYNVVFDGKSMTLQKYTEILQCNSTSVNSMKRKIVEMYNS